MELTFVNGEIVKTEKTDDGLIVFGKATGPDLDIDKQICDPGWLEKAMPAWMEWGNVREGHTNLAAGVGMELEQNGPDWHLKSLCVDPTTQRKLEAKVLKGYSIGIKGAQIVKDSQAPGGRIVGGEIVEISYVDRPANPDCKVTIAKSAGGGADLQPVEAPEDDRAARGAEIAGQVKALFPDLAKADNETSDIAGATQAIAIIARLIQSEAEGLAAGQLSEAYDIDCLLDAVRALRWFRENEALEPDTEGSDMDLVSLGVNADTVKAAAAENATDEQKAAPRVELAKAIAADIAKALGIDSAGITKTIDDTVKSTLEEPIRGLEERLATVEEMAAPGGPARTRTQADATKAAKIEQLRADADRFRHFAVQATDPDLATGYRAKAAEADKQLAALT